MKKEIKEFVDKQEAKGFALEFYGDFANSLGELRTKVGSIQASGRYTTEPQDKFCIDAIKEMFWNCPKTPFDIVAYRCGEMKYDNRPYLSASLLKSGALGHGDCPNKIVIKKGSLIFPLRALGLAYGDSEAEIIIVTKCLKKKSGYYIYK